MPLSHDRPFRLAIIGAGMVSETLHVPAALASPRVDIVALVDPQIGRAERLAHDYGLQPRLAARAEEVLDFVEGVIIATPNNSHRDIAIACAKRGVHCLIEKPLATSVAEAEDICRAAETSGIVVAVGYSTRFRDEVDLVRDVVRSGAFGAVLRFHFQEGTVGGWSPVSAYNLDRKAAGGGVLSIVGAHFLDRMLYWFGYPDEVELEDDGYAGPEAQAFVTVRYRSSGRNFEGTIRLSKLFHLKAGFVMETDDGTFVLPIGASPLRFLPNHNPDLQLTLQPRGGPRYPAGKDNFQIQLEDFIEACRGNRQPLVTARQGLESIRLLEHLYRGRRPLSDASQNTSNGPG